MGGFEVKNSNSLIVTVCIASLEAIGELQRERLHHSCATEFNWNGQNAWTSPASEELSTLVIVYTERGYGRHLLYGRSQHALRRLV